MLSTVSSSPFLRSPSPPLVKISSHRSPPPRSSVRFQTTAVSHLAPSTCLYEVLGIPAGASREDIKAAYRRLARTCHPDVAERPPAVDFVRINAAYSTLSDPEKRADYDRRISRWPNRYGGGVVSSSSPATGFYGYTCRNWETDQCW